MYPHLLVEHCREIEDHARGRRRVWSDGAGRITRLESGDGSIIRIERDLEGRLARVCADDGSFVSVENKSDRHWEFTDAGGVTHIQADHESYSLQRGMNVLTFQRLQDGRIRRVFLPGSQRPLEYQWSADGTCVIGGVIEVRQERAGIGFRTALGCVDERHEPLGVKLVTESDEVEIGHDLLGRTVQRCWSDGFRERFERDASGRLTAWMRGDISRAYRYDGAELCAEEEGDQIARRILSSSGRVLQLIHPDGSAVDYSYDDAGRRVRRNSAHYQYDGLGHLTEVVAEAGGRVRFAYDGLGRRVSVSSSQRERLEHRDAAGRLWAVTDEFGRSLHVFIWRQGRLLARIDGSVGDPLAEVFLTDPAGTLIGVLGPAGFQRIVQPPFGAVQSAARPTLYGHIGDPETGLIDFGARFLDPELGLFLTPDAWHCAADDPRMWADARLGDLRPSAEYSFGGIHPYALCQFDPAGLMDLDGHQSKTVNAGLSAVNTIATLILLPTWGWPLTAVSLFFFFPLNLYFEIFGLLWTTLARIFSSQSGFWIHHPYETLSVFRSIGLLGSSRQGIFAAGLNGFLPRFVSGHFDFATERAVTVGNVVWMDRHEMNRMERPTALLVDNLAGFNADPNPGKLSVICVEGTQDGKKRFHASFWSRGFGNALKTVGGQLSFDDKVVGGTSQAAIHLALPFPLDFPLQANNTPTLQEYLFDPAVNKTSTATVIRDTWFALQTTTGIKLQKDDPIEITAPKLDPPEPAVHMTISDIQTDVDFSTLILSGVLPPKFRDQKMTITRVRVQPGGAETAGWVAGGANTELKASAPGADTLGQLIAIDTLIKLTGTAAPPPAPPPPGVAPPAGPPTQFTRIKEVGVTLQLSSPLPAKTAANDKVRLLESDGDSFDAVLPDPATSDQFKWKGSHGGIKKDDLISISTSTGDKVTFGIVKPSADDTLSVELVAPKLDVAAGTQVRIQKLNDKSSEKEEGTVAAEADDNIPLTVHRLGIYNKGLLVHFKPGGKDAVRTIKDIGEIKLTLTEPAPGSAPFKVVVAQTESATTVRGATTSKLLRFLEFTGPPGNPPSAFGKYPDFLINLSMSRFVSLSHTLSKFFAQTDAPGFDETFHAKWKPFSRDSKDYFVLESDLPYEEKKTDVFWRFDPDTRGDDDRTQVTGPPDPYVVTIREFQKAGGASRNTFTAEQARVQVPEYPSTADTHAESLRQHELHHAQQNTHWGPFMGALPIAGVERIIELAGTDPKERDDWLAQGDDEKRKAVDQFKGAQWASMGSLMQLTWMYAFAFGKANSVKFEQWNRLFNPLAGKIIHDFPDTDPNAPLSDKPGFALLQILNTFSDLRSWFPFIGWVPAILPDGARSFLEQGASRASGDLYSTILSADDKFNREVSSRLIDIVPDYHTANITKPIGQVTRLMFFPEGRGERVLARDFRNSPGSPITYAETFLTQEPLTIKADVDVLLHPDLFEPVPISGGPALPAPAALAGPASNSATVNFLNVPAGTLFRPTLRPVVPTPLTVNRSTGWYFIPTTPAKYSFEAFYRDAASRVANSDKDAKTQEVTLTIEAGEVTFADEKVNHQTPTPAAPASTFDRFVSEVPQLIIKSQPFKDQKWWEVNVTDNAAAALPAGFVKVDSLANGWKLTIDKALPGGAADQAVRVRVFRIFKKNDANDDSNNEPGFDLTFDPKQHPTLRNIRSYLDSDLWIPIRDFVFTVKPLPPLSPDGKPKKIDTEQDFLLNLALPMRGEVKPVSTLTPPAPAGAPPRLEIEKTGNKGTQPRGEEWRIKPLGPVLEDPATYKVSVTYGTGASPDPLELTIEPHIRIKKAAGQADFVATKATPCNLDIEGGDGDYKVSTEEFPNDASAKIQPPGGTRIVVTVSDQLKSTAKGVVVVTDKSGKKGRRTVALRKG